MKAHRLLFENLIDINPRTGTIKLNDKRMALVSVEALGILRRDLINTLSMERAKGFLMRYGWACGYRDGASMEQMYEWESKKELMLSGPALHTLEGIVTVEPDTIELDDDRLYFTGYWKNSFEADEHISHYGHSDETVCWMLVGYASGFLTKTFGKEVVVHEKHCRGKKDPHCYFVAQTVEHCDAKQKEDLRYYHAESLLSELDKVHQEVKQLNENIIQSEQVQNQLTDLLLEDKELTDAIELLAHHLGRSIVIDRHDEPVDSTFLIPAHKEAYHLWVKHGSVGEKIRETYLHAFPIQANSLVLGRMAVIGDRKLDNKEQMIIKRSLMICAILMFHQRKLTQSLWKRKEDFFEEIINNTYDEETLKRRAHIFDFNPNESNRIITIKLTSKEQTADILNFISSKFPKLDMFIKKGYIIIIMPEQGAKSVEPFLNRLLRIIHSKFPDVKTYIGSGRAAESLSKLGKSFHDACRICDFVQLSYPMDSRSATFEELEPIILFLKGADQEELLLFCQQTIGKLVKYDEENQGNLVMTLQSYLDNNGNLQQTASDLHLSIAGLRYRLERIESLCDIDLKTGSGRFRCQLSIRIYFSLQMINKRYYAHLTV